MPIIVARPLWAGRATAVIGILLVALNLRTAVAAISPIVGAVSADIPLDSVGLGILGMLPPTAFAVSGIVAPMVARRIGLELTLVLACIAMVIGPVVRAVGDDYAVLVAGSVIALAGMGFGNILLPPAVKKYFPERMGAITAGYVTLISLGAAIPAILAAPVADSAGWRVSVGVWAVLAAAALVPWLIGWASARRARRADDVRTPRAQLVGSMWRSRTAWAILVAFAVSSVSFYGMFAWLPELLIQSAGLTPLQAGALLSLYGLVGIPFGLVLPSIAARMRNVGLLIIAGVVVMLLGNAGLLFAPTVVPWLWVVLAGGGNILFPLCLVLINLRTRSPAASAALSGFVQSVGYSIAALGPFAIALLRDLSGGWVAPLVFLSVVGSLAIGSAIVLRRPRFVEDELSAQNTGSQNTGSQNTGSGDHVGAVH